MFWGYTRLRVRGTPTDTGMMSCETIWRSMPGAVGSRQPSSRPRPADDAPRHARPMHTADVRLMDTEANETWIDVMVTAAQPARPITDSLREAEQHKCREYGLGVLNPAVLHQGLVPFVIEQHGHPASCAQAVADYLIVKKARHMESTLGLDMVPAKRQAAQAFWSPISCLLAKAAYRSLAECQAFRAPDRPAIGAELPEAT